MKTNKIWKKTILIFTITGLIAGGGATAFFWKDNIPKKPSEWNAYSSKDQRFDVQFPADPQESSEQMVVANTKIQYNELRTQTKDSVYAVSYIDFPGHWKWLGTKKLLSKSFESFIESQDQVEEVIEQQISTHHGMPALEYRLRQAGKEIKGKFIIAGNTLYRIAITYPLAMVETTQAEPFFNSFQIKG